MSEVHLEGASNKANRWRESRMTRKIAVYEAQHQEHAACCFTTRLETESIRLGPVRNSADRYGRRDGDVRVRDRFQCCDVAIERRRANMCRFSSGAQGESSMLAASVAARGTTREMELTRLR